jgi:hypothetical protein
MIGLQADRRAHERLPVERPCKVYDARSGRYLAGMTRDISGGGMLLQLSRAAVIEPGAELYVGIAEKRRQTLLRAAEMMRVRVARSVHSPEGGTMIGVELLDPPAVADVALRRAA